MLRQVEGKEREDEAPEPEHERAREQDPRGARHRPVAVAEPRTRSRGELTARPGRWYPETEGGHVDPGREVGAGIGVAGGRDQREDPGPDRQRDVRLVVFRRAGADLGGRLLERDREEERLAVFGGRGHPGLILAAGCDMSGDRRGGRVEFVLVGDLASRPEDHDGPVVHRMVEGAPRHHEAVDDGGHDADLGARAERLPRAGGCGAVQVDRVADAGVDRREAARSAVAIVEGDVADQGFVEDRVDRGAVVVAPFGVTVDLRAFGRCRHAGEHPTGDRVLRFPY